MTSTSPRSYRYRWVVLLAFMAVIFVNQLLWITFASITGPAAKYYGVTDLAIAALALSFMVVYIVVSVPASWVIDTYGLRIGVGDVAKGQRSFAVFRQMGAADIDRSGMVIALDPDPAPPRHKAGQPAVIGLIQFLDSGEVVETVAKTDDGCRIAHQNVMFQPRQGFLVVMGRQQTAALARQPMRFAEMQVRHCKNAAFRPPEATTGQGSKAGRGKREIIATHPFSKQQKPGWVQGYVA